MKVRNAQIEIDGSISARRVSRTADVDLLHIHMRSGDAVYDEDALYIHGKSGDVIEFLSDTLDACQKVMDNEKESGR